MSYAAVRAPSPTLVPGVYPVCVVCVWGYLCMYICIYLCVCVCVRMYPPPHLVCTPEADQFTGERGGG